MTPSNDEILKFFKTLMQHCRLERKSHRPVSNLDLAKRLQVTPNYVSALENGRATPSLETFFRYLLIAGFDIRLFLKLSIKGTGRLTELSHLREQMSELIPTLDEHQLRFLLEQGRLSQTLKIRLKKSKTEK